MSTVDDEPATQLSRPVMYTREEWGARPPRGRETFSSAPNGVFLHYTASGFDETLDHSKCAERVRGIQTFHMGPSRGWNDIAYSFLYCRHGAIFEGRGWGVQGAHTVGYNSTAHAFCFLGADRDGRDDLTDEGRYAVSWLINEAFRRYPEGRQVRGHGDVNPTECPGREIRAYIACHGWHDSTRPHKDADKFRGYWKWLAWTLGAGEFKDDGPSNKSSRPDVPRRIPAAWWARRRKFVKRQNGK